MEEKMDYAKELSGRKYPLSVTFDQARAIGRDYNKLHKLMLNGREMTKEEYELSNKIRGAILHPAATQ